MEMYTKDSGPRGFWPQELCARETGFFLQEGCARFCCLLEICPKLCKRDSFKRVVQECFFTREMSKAVQERFFQESSARVFFFAREMSKAVQEKFFQESCARVFFSVREMSRVAQDLLLS
jgi:hypothetical protein